MVDGPETVKFKNRSMEDTFAWFSRVGNYKLRLTVKNGESILSDDVEVKVLNPLEDCKLIDAYWNVTSAFENDFVDMIAVGKKCDGTLIGFNIQNDANSYIFLDYEIFNNSIAKRTLRIPFYCSITKGVIKLTCGKDTVIHRFTANVDEMDHKIISNSLTVKLKKQYNPPIVDAGPDRRIKFGHTLLLNATVIDDGLPNAPGKITMEWKIDANNPGIALFSNLEDTVTEVYFPTKGEYHLSLYTEDGSYAVTNSIVVEVE